jgi:hypothetical protein
MTETTKPIDPEILAEAEAQIQEALDSSAWVEDQPLTESEEEGVRQAVAALKTFQELTLVQSIANSVRQDWNDMLTGQGKGTVKNNKFNEGYMKALDDIYKGITVLLHQITNQNPEEPANDNT